MEKKTIIAIILVGLIIIFTQTDFYKSRVLPQPQGVFPDTSMVMELQRPDSLQKELNEITTIDAPDAPQESIADSRKTNPILSAGEGEQGEVKETTIVSPLFNAVLSNRGGGLVKWQLMKYLDTDSNFVNLIPDTELGLPGIGMVIEQDSVRFDDLIYNVSFEELSSTGEIRLGGDGSPFTIEYALDLTSNRRIVKEYTFYGDRYKFDLSVTLEGFSDLTIDRSYHLRWDASLLPTEEPITDDLNYIKVYANIGDDLQDFDIDEDEKQVQNEEMTGTVNWAALRTKYFCSAIVPIDSKGRSITYMGHGFNIAPGQNFKYFNYAINMPFLESSVERNEFSLYLGPLEYNKLKSHQLGLESLIMSSGGYERLFRPFSIIILVSLKFMHQFISNYGWVIVIFSILIKLILYPLTHKSYTSMKKMQLVQPLMTDIREKYKSDPQRLNKEMMKLYKEHGVNPLGGCLPMVLQMPLLIGLFIVFRSTIELRGAEFIFWISDLSKPDTIFSLPFALPLYGSKINVLPIVMGLSMFLQQKSTISDPRQKMMMYFMPVFFLFLFNTFPSGLNLYYTLFNFLTIFQQKFVKTEDLQLKPVEQKAGKGKNRKK